MLSNEEFNNEKIHVDTLAVQTSATLFRLLSHELRNPLSNIITTSNFYIEEQSDLAEDRKTALISSILSDATTVLSQIENIVSISRLTNTPLQLKRAELDSVLANAIRRVRSKMPALQISIYSNLDSLSLPMDPVLMEHALIILLQFLYQQAACNDISCNAILSKKSVTLLLQTEVLNSTTLLDTPIEHHTLELDICKLIITAHSGKLHIATKGTGIICQIELPIKE